MMATRVVAVLIALATPGLFAPFLARLQGKIPAGLWTLQAGIICIVPLSAPFWLIRIRNSRIIFLIGILGGIVMIKAIDWLASPQGLGNPLRVLLALTFWPGLEIEDVAVPIGLVAERMELLVQRLFWGVGSLVCGLIMAAAGQSLGVSDHSVWIDSSIKCVEIYLIAGGLNHLMVAAFCATGFRMSDGFRYPFLAHSILDFWSRYNVWIHRWLKKQIFEPIGWRKRRPVIGILAVFAVSGLLHEYLMVPVAPDLRGCQFGFFGLHGLGAVAGARLGKRYRAVAGRLVPRSLAIAATVAFVLATAPLFILCLDRVVNLHRDLGAWILRIWDT